MRKLEKVYDVTIESLLVLSVIMLTIASIRLLLLITGII